MNHLVPCPECSRHVRVSETQCPFCALPLDLAGAPEPQLPKTRLGRAATFAFGATLASVTVVAACGGEATQSSGGDGGKASSAGTSAGGGAAGVGGKAGGAGASGFGGTVNVAPPYGLPPIGGSGAIYGGPPPNIDEGGAGGAAGAGGVE